MPDSMIDRVGNAIRDCGADWEESPHEAKLIAARAAIAAMPPFTDEAVEAALVAFWCDPQWAADFNMCQADAELLRKDMHRALQAAIDSITEQEKREG